MPDEEPYYDGVHPYPVARPKPDNWHSLIGKIGANERWSREPDRYAATQPARDGLMRKFEDQVDPDRTLAPDERARRVASARKAYFQRLALKSAQARRAKKGRTTVKPDESGAESSGEEVEPSKPVADDGT